MSKRAEEAALKAYPRPLFGPQNITDDDCNRQVFIRGYEKGEKDTTQRALDWLKAHTKSYAGPIEEPFWTMFIEHFKKAMEE